jgi:inhibitor of KinA
LIPPLSITALTEQCALVQWPHELSVDINEAVMRLHRRLNRQPFAGFAESVPAYQSLAVFYDVIVIRQQQANAFEYVKRQIEERLNQPAELMMESYPVMEIPVRYGGEEGPDMETVMQQTGLSQAEIIRLHTSADYRVFMMGFAPGFPYLGITHEQLNVARLPTPRLRVPAGSVGLAGRQTGIYPFASPGGWQIIGRTEMALFDVSRLAPCLLQPGQVVKFVAAPVINC